jgi:NADPH:quinone reductase-like Zn-dependent oxidoreductase
VQAAGIRRFGGGIEVLELPAPRALGGDEVLISVRAAGVGNWDEYVRTGGWDTGARPPMALGVEAAGIVTAIGPGVRDFSIGTAVTTHSLPFPEQGGWAQALIARAAHMAVVPPGVPIEGPRLGRLVGLLAAGVLTLEVGTRYRLEDAAIALLAAMGGTGGAALVIEPG